jgi:hypothetical protein
VQRTYGSDDPLRVRVRGVAVVVNAGSHPDSAFLRVARDPFGAGTLSIWRRTVNWISKCCAVGCEPLGTPSPIRGQPAHLPTEYDVTGNCSGGLFGAGRTFAPSNVNSYRRGNVAILGLGPAPVALFMTTSSGTLPRPSFTKTTTRLWRLNAMSANSIRSMNPFERIFPSRP